MRKMIVLLMGMLMLFALAFCVIFDDMMSEKNEIILRAASFWGKGTVYLISRLYMFHDYCFTRIVFQGWLGIFLSLVLNDLRYHYYIKYKPLSNVWIYFLRNNEIDY